MDHRFDELSVAINHFNYESHNPLHDPTQSLNFADGFEPNEPALNFDSIAAPLLSTGTDGLNNNTPASIYTDHLNRGSIYSSGSLGQTFDLGGKSPASSNGSNSSDPALKYISQMLLEDNMDETPLMVFDDFALQNTEKSLYDALGLPNEHQTFDTSQFIWTPSSNLSGSSSESSVGTSAVHDPRGYSRTSTSPAHPLDRAHPTNLDGNSAFCAKSFAGETNGLVNEHDSITHFQRGLEEASKFLPPSNQLVIDLENISSGFGAKMGTVLGGSRGRKNHEREDLGLVEGRATKQTVSYVEPEEAELSDLLDKLLLCTEKVEPLSSTGSRILTDPSKDLSTSAPVRGSNGGRRRGRGRRPGKTSSVDLRALLIQCAQAISLNDLSSANALLKQIRESSSPSGDGSQRLAHYFANGLEARIERNCGDTLCFHSLVASRRRSAVDFVKSHQLYISSCPFKRLSIFYMNYMVWKLSRKARVLHIIDFGIRFGFQWPLLIQKLGERADGPPKLRITGIDLPQPGLHPAEWIEVTGRRLALYCKRFNVPFEFNALPSSNWETIKVEDLKIKSGEMIAVNSLIRFKNLLDESVEEDSPRDAVLNLIRRIKPDVFLHTVASGSYNAPFFMPRFKEALFHLSSVYDMLDATITGEDRVSDERTIFESELYGREIMNVIAFEGPERAERPETYKQWQVRHARAGFKQLALDQEATRKLRYKLEAWYHKDFMLIEDWNWMLMGWKGRVMYATTCLVPA